MNDLDRISRYISMILRHKPEEIGSKLDNNGYIKTSELVDGVKKRYPEFTKTDLEQIVAEDSKQRYSFKDDKKYIRANQGHSIKIDLELSPQVPPLLLFHGTSSKYLDSILKEGILPKSRQYVHLSKDVDTAHTVGLRHGAETVILVVSAEQMHKDGYKFFISDNGVWLTDTVPTKYFTLHHVNSSFDLKLLKMIVGEYDEHLYNSESNDAQKN